MAKLPFSIFRRSGRRYYYVQFKNETNGEYYPAISTKQETEEAATKIAFTWLRDGIPQKREAIKIQDLSLKDTARKIKTKAEAEILLKELKRLGWLKNYILTETIPAQDFAEFLSEFWTWEKSAYIAEKRRRNHGLHKYHCMRQKKATQKYWVPFFKDRCLGDITSADIDAFFTHMGNLPLSASSKNNVIIAGTKPLRWAFSKGKIETDPTRGHILFSGE